MNDKNSGVSQKGLANPQVVVAIVLLIALGISFVGNIFLYLSNSKKDALIASLVKTEPETPAPTTP